MQSEKERARQKAELDRLPIGTPVLVRGAAGAGLGIVREHITMSGDVPMIGWAKAVVVFWDDFGVQQSVIKTTELYRAPQAKAIQGTFQNIRHIRNAAKQAKRPEIVALCDEAERYGAGSRSYTILCDHMTTGAPLPPSATVAQRRAQAR